MPRNDNSFLCTGAVEAVRIALGKSSLGRELGQKGVRLLARRLSAATRSPTLPNDHQSRAARFTAFIESPSKRSSDSPLKTWLRDTRWAWCRPEFTDCEFKKRKFSKLKSHLERQVADHLAAWEKLLGKDLDTYKAYLETSPLKALNYLVEGTALFPPSTKRQDSLPLLMTPMGNLAKVKWWFDKYDEVVQGISMERSLARRRYNRAWLELHLSPFLIPPMACAAQGPLYCEADLLPDAETPSHPFFKAIRNKTDEFNRLPEDATSKRWKFINRVLSGIPGAPDLEQLIKTSHHNADRIYEDLQSYARLYLDNPHHLLRFADPTYLNVVLRQQDVGHKAIQMWLTTVHAQSKQQPKSLALERLAVHLAAALEANCISSNAAQRLLSESGLEVDDIPTGLTDLLRQPAHLVLSKWIDEFRELNATKSADRIYNDWHILVLIYGRIHKPIGASRPSKIDKSGLRGGGNDEYRFVSGVEKVAELIAALTSRSIVLRRKSKGLGSFGDSSRDESAKSPAQEAIDKEEQALLIRLTDLLSSLPSHEREMIQLKYGCYHDRAYTDQQLGERFGISPARVKRIIKKVLKKLKCNLDD